MNEIEKLLKQNNLKITNQRIKTLDVIINLDNNATINNIKEKLYFDKSTIYRIINLLMEKNIIEKNIDNKKIYYSLKEEHKHYIKCIKCNKKEEIEECLIKKIENKGYKVLNHKLEIEGICSNCLEK